MSEVTALGGNSAVQGTGSQLVDNGAPNEKGLLVNLVLLLISASLASIVFAYASLPVYRVLEGLALPQGIQRRLMRRQLRQWSELQVLFDLTLRGIRPMTGLELEKMASYPSDRAAVRPTRLGNALAALETFGTSRYGLDSQKMWYELQAVSTEAARKQTEDGRMPVDFFVGTVAYMGIVSLVSITTAAFKPTLSLILLAIIALLWAILAYNLAVKNVKDWTQTVKALVSLGRIPLANELGLRMPDELRAERTMWETYLRRIEFNDESALYTAYYDGWRLRTDK